MVFKSQPELFHDVYSSALSLISVHQHQISRGGISKSMKADVTWDMHAHTFIANIYTNNRG